MIYGAIGEIYDGLLFLWCFINENQLRLDRNEEYDEFN